MTPQWIRRSISEDGRPVVLPWAILAVLSSLLAAYALVYGVAPDNQPKLVLLVCAGIAVTAGIVRPTVALAALIALAPFNFSVRIGSLETDTNSVLAVVVAVIVARFATIDRSPRPALLGALLMVLGGALAAVGATLSGDAWWGTCRWLLVLTVMLAAFTLVPSSLFSLRSLTRIVAAAVAGVAILGIAQRAGIYAISGPPFDATRPDATFGYYTQFAAFMAIGLIVTLGGAGDALERRAHGELSLYAGAAVLASVGLVLALNRGALLLAVGGLAVALALQARHLGRAARSLTAAISLVGVAALLVPSGVIEAFIARFTSRQGGDGNRSALQETGFRALEHEPFGIGFGNFPQYLERHFQNTTSTKVLFHAHDTFVQIGLDLGLLGLLGFALLVLSPLVAAFSPRRFGRFDPIGASYVGALTGLLLLGVNDYLYAEMSYLTFTAMLVWASWVAVRVTSAGRRPA